MGYIWFCINSSQSHDTPTETVSTFVLDHGKKVAGLVVLGNDCPAGLGNWPLRVRAPR